MASPGDAVSTSFIPAEARLDRYREKRDFTVTSEPAPGGKHVVVPERARFMVHKHDATRLHYDLRFETDGVLASWACPKGPSYDPAQKRLAVQTEDHPLEYGEFEGRIPDGEYGAGDSIIWERGTFDTRPPGQFAAQVKKGSLHLLLQGEKLQGEWHLIRTRPQGGKQQWLFFKAKDGTERTDYDVVAERPESVESGRRTTEGPGRKAALKKTPAVRATTVPVARVALTHPERVLFPQTRFTKADVRAYYDAVAAVMVPALEGRALSMQQFPQGIMNEGFFRHAAATAPSWISRAVIRHSDKDVEHLVVDRPETLSWLANQSALTLHMMSSRVATLDSPDWVAFDFDPPDGTWTAVVPLVKALKGLLDELQLPSVPKTSGKRGLHVFVPLAPGHTHDAVHDFAVDVVNVLAAAFPSLATSLRAKKSREGRLYLDPEQNAKLKTMVAPYSIRAVEGAPVSTPLHWDEVSTSLDPTAFTIRTMEARLAREGDLFAPARTGRGVLPIPRDRAVRVASDMH